MIKEDLYNKSIYCKNLEEFKKIQIILLNLGFVWGQGGNYLCNYYENYINIYEKFEKFNINYNENCLTTKRTPVFNIIDNFLRKFKLEKLNE